MLQEHFETVYETNFRTFLFQRLSMLKTTKFMKDLVVFFAYYIIRYTSSSLIAIIKLNINAVSFINISRYLISLWERHNEIIFKMATSYRTKRCIFDL